MKFSVNNVVLAAALLLAGGKGVLAYDCSVMQCFQDNGGNLPTPQTLPYCYGDNMVIGYEGGSEEVCRCYKNGPPAGFEALLLRRSFLATTFLEDARPRRTLVYPESLEGNGPWGGQPPVATLEVVGEKYGTKEMRSSGKMVKRVRKEGGGGRGKNTEGKENNGRVAQAAFRSGGTDD
ncbi:predicted protein [Chaetomium globosum CBS 148.51]|uniref:Cyanovirin-N domain-containing protein n=1 Tax=Chaetomium globosum (strain ATCC 6205 / CBS 148.51 / DSM 1962 / NBRC 6347 / NRRL 1970) TaxID=306901 RepID=Q2GWM4_CHAGB|nr:uncharacterized protein CHGG_07630 [Chaetomium globosum CBS 148.51]EAQ86377.1 predicted protein [Chaetomium globosum CBS 148.51]